MPQPTTETLHDRARGLDTLPPLEIAAVLAEAQHQAAAVAGQALPGICAGAARMAETIRRGGRLVYAAAGSSALMAAADAMELGGTFAIPPAQVRILMAGGLPQGAEMPGATEDDTEGLVEALADLGPADTVIAVSASGTTPYTLAAARIAQARGAAVIGIANNPGSALLLEARLPVCLPTPPEPVAGSTRMGAGTAQKIALNMLSTLMAVELGHIHDGMMVNVVADNAKLEARAATMVARIAGAAPEAAAAALSATAGRVKPAVLLAAGAPSALAADQLLDASHGNLRTALARLGANS